MMGLAEETNVTATVSETNLNIVKPEKLKHQKPQRGATNTGIPNTADIEETRATSTSS